ncbi:SRPBCC family protein [Rhizobium halophilum]|uniref:SRPBCC family protein n=1 Tax=Rhizobium halophilum TaxID=2846852 RepID=UPI001EFE0E6B|nr:SRPBCC family protein [Rhizobium halophilum]MCF6368684.1 SRPBCC family protein [Rhizobium halophilum]
MAVAEAMIIHVSIDAPWDAVFDFARRPENLGAWAAGLAAGLRPAGPEWIGNGGPFGEIRIRFASDNDLGVIDHDVMFPDGTVVHNAFRIVPNGDGAEAMFTLIRQAGMDDAAFSSDAAAIRRDLDALKSLMEMRNPE